MVREEDSMKSVRKRYRHSKVVTHEIEWMTDSGRVEPKKEDKKKQNKDDVSGLLDGWLVD